MHEYHERLQGFDARQIWHDGCGECERRGKGIPYSIGKLDAERFAAAWKRSWAWNDEQEVGAISDAEKPLLDLLYVIQVALQRNCGLPMGELPRHRSDLELLEAVEDSEVSV